MLGLPADVLSVAYAIAALYTAILLWRGRRDVFDERFTAHDRQLAVLVGMLYLTPIGVLAHEMAHLVTARALGAQDLSLHFHLYWGYVTYFGALSPGDEFLIAAAGPAASVALGLAALVLALRLHSFAQSAVWTFGL